MPMEILICIKIRGLTNIRVLASIESDYSIKLQVTEIYLLQFLANSQLSRTILKH